MELAQAIIRAANCPGDRDDLQAIAREIIARSNAADAATLAGAILLTVALMQAKTTPPRRISWRPSQVKRRRKFSVA
jgi:hypothetical protein